MDKRKDALDKLVIFLAKRDGIDKLVKTFQYVGKLAHYNLEYKNPKLAARYKNLEVAAGLSRKAFRSGRFLTGFNALRTSTYPDLTVQVLTIFGFAGEMVYWLFDHFTWLSKVGVLDARIAPRMMYISAFGENVGYVFFITLDVVLIKRGMAAEAALRKQLLNLVAESEEDRGVQVLIKSEQSEQIRSLKAKISAIRMQRIMLVMSIIAQTSDFFIALSVVDPNLFVTHPVTLGLSGLASAWAGWYRNWPASN